jgi:hypothetical protein
MAVMALRTFKVHRFRYVVFVWIREEIRCLFRNGLKGLVAKKTDFGRGIGLRFCLLVASEACQPSLLVEIRRKRFLGFLR